MYHPLSRETGGTSEQARQEATDLVNRIMEHADKLSDKERAFVEEMDDESIVATPKRLYWLRDIWARFA